MNDKGIRNTHTTQHTAFALAAGQQIYKNKIGKVLVCFIVFVQRTHSISFEIHRFCHVLCVIVFARLRVCSDSGRLFSSLPYRHNDFDHVMTAHSPPAPRSLVTLLIVVLFRTWMGAGTQLAIFDGQHAISNRRAAISICLPAAESTADNTHIPQHIEAKELWPKCFCLSAINFDAIMNVNSWISSSHMPNTLATTVPDWINAVLCVYFLRQMNGCIGLTWMSRTCCSVCAILFESNVNLFNVFSRSHSHIFVDGQGQSSHSIQLTFRTLHQK